MPESDRVYDCYSSVATYWRFSVTANELFALYILSEEKQTDAPIYNRTLKPNTNLQEMAGCLITEQMAQRRALPWAGVVVGIRAGAEAVGILRVMPKSLATPRKSVNAENSR